MFFHKQELHFSAKPEQPDAVYARKLQEVLGGQYGEITVALQYSFQAWNTHIPSNFPQRKEQTEVSYRYQNFSDGQHAKDGSWASGPSLDGIGEHTYHDGPTTSAPMPDVTRPDVRSYGTTDVPNAVEKAAGTIQDKLDSRVTATVPVRRKAT